MTAALEMETKRTGFVTCVEVLLDDGSRCFYPKAELATRPPEVVAVCVGRADVFEPERRQPTAFTPVSSTGYYSTRGACLNNCDSLLVILCNGRRSAAKGHCICSCHKVAR